MNLQTMSIILIIIVLPITLILTAYTKIQIDTIALQTQYRTKLSDATYDAVTAFQINTVNNSYSTVSDSMRRDVSAVIQTFITSLATNLGLSGTDEINMKPYIPAIVFTLYDGYYIYSPSISHTIKGGETGSTEGVETTSYEHVLKPYIYYTARYKNENVDVIVNFSLDNYVVVTGMVGGEQVTKAGYLVNIDKIPEIEKEETLERILPVTVIAFEDQENRNFIQKPTIFDTTTAKMVVSNAEGMVTDRYSNGYLLKDSRVFKNIEELSINNPSLTPATANRGTVDKLQVTAQLIRNEYDKAISANSDSAKGSVLKKWFAPYNVIDTMQTTKEFDLGYYVSASTDEYYIPANSAFQYYYGSTEAENDGGAIEFTKWFNNSFMSSIKASDAIKPDGTSYGFSDEYVFRINNQNDPEDEASVFSDHRRNIIRESIQANLSQAIASYNQNSEGLNILANFQMPKLSEQEWDQVLNNVCLITFMQGIQVGTKIFNDYCIVTSTTNKEYVAPDSIYFVNQTDEEVAGTTYYHKIGCPNLRDDQKIVGYRNSDFERRSYEIENEVSFNESNDESVTPVGNIVLKYEKDKTYYYYMHSEEACYDCIVNANARLVDWENDVQYANRRKAFYTALAREKFNFYKTNEYFDT